MPYFEQYRGMGKNDQFTNDYTFDAFGRVDTEESSAELFINSKTSSKKIKNVYQNGSLKTIKDFVTNEIISNVEGVNARGQATSITMGNDMREQNTYDAYGYLTESKIDKNASSSAVELMKLTNTFDTQRGLLMGRTNSMFSWTENFTYDSMDRLVNFNDINGTNNHTYDLLGRITTNSAVGDYAYAGTSYQVSDIDLNNQGDIYFQEKALQQITYNAFKKPVEINQEGKEKIGFQYNAFMGRSHMYYGDTQSDKLLRKSRKHYSSDGSMEISYDTASGNTTFVTYMGGDGYSAPAIWRSEQTSSTTTNDYYYLHRDYLGSILMISDKNGTVKEKRHFDAWGNIVKLTNGTNENPDKFVYLDRGYTGHEHLQGVSLIHMNGRLYDPKLKRFLAPDNYIQDVGNTQNFNRYSYVLNNPLMYVDYSGETYGPPCECEQPNYYTPDQQNGLAVAIKEFFDKNIKPLQIGRWLDRNANSAGQWFGKQASSISNWVGGWFKKAKAAPIEYSNYEGLSSDPLAGPSTNIPASYFGGGGTDTGGLGINQSSNSRPLEVNGNSKIELLTTPYIVKDFDPKKPIELGMGLFEWVEGAGITKLYDVYHLVNKETKIVEYVGKTRQGMLKRFDQHLLDPAKEAWITKVYPVLYKGGLTKFEAKYYEQTEILRLGLGNLSNKINGVAEKYWTKYGIK